MGENFRDRSSDLRELVLEHPMSSDVEVFSDIEVNPNNSNNVNYDNDDSLTEFSSDSESVYEPDKDLTQWRDGHDSEVGSTQPNIDLDLPGPSNTEKLLFHLVMSLDLLMNSRNSPTRTVACVPNVNLRA
ncbi:hypothetical protein J6590_014006 [Homalodisca vitripennis]|nr:hypothetical protein J6590_014006 [Homalodisca vitripennis]